MKMLSGRSALRSPKAADQRSTPCCCIGAAQSNQSAFETADEAQAEDRFRAKGLRMVLPQHGPAGWLKMRHVHWLAKWRASGQTMPPLDYEAGWALVAALEADLRGGLPPRTLASSLSMRSIRQAVVEGMLTGFEPYSNEQLRTFTLLNQNWVFTPEALDGVHAARLVRQLRTHLHRAGVLDLPCPLIAFLHGEFDPVAGVFVLHFHGATTAPKAQALHELKGKWGYVKSRTRAAPVRCRPVRDRARQFSYLLKSYWPSRGVRDQDGVLMRDRKGHRIPEPFHSQVLLWLDRHNLADITLMNDCWSPRSGGSEAMRALYLSVHHW
ncbi:MAG TPA: hypothetical protein VGN97_02725 [Mesorhizobium sp.]|jgi:hypothetical protein|nr:hypothetical protein [Mesorhizobium sp.]